MPDLTCQFEASFQTPHMACNAVTGAGEKPLTHDAQSAKSLRIAPKRRRGSDTRSGQATGPGGGLLCGVRGPVRRTKQQPVSSQ